MVKIMGVRFNNPRPISKVWSRGKVLMNAKKVHRFNAPPPFISIQVKDIL